MKQSGLKPGFRVLALMMGLVLLLLGAADSKGPESAPFDPSRFCIVEYKDGVQTEDCGVKLEEIEAMYKRIYATPDPNEVYDLVIDIDTIKSVLAASASGWEITIGPQAAKLFGPKKSLIAAVLGRFKQGKSWITSKILKAAKLDRPNYMTKGLSFACSTSAASMLCVIDSAGGSTPVNPNIEGAVSDRNARFDLLEEVELDIADVMIVVVDDLTYSDQEHLIHVEKVLEDRTQAASRSKGERNPPKMVVFHNLKNVVYKMTGPETSTLDSYYENFRKIYTECSNDTLAKYPALKVCRRKFGGELINHIFLARDVDLGIGYNEMAFDYFLSLFNYVVESERDVFAETLQSIQNSLARRYIVPSNNGNLAELTKFKLGMHLAHKDSPMKVSLLPSVQNAYELIVIQPLGSREQHSGRQPFLSAFVVPNERREVWIIAEAAGATSLDQVKRKYDRRNGILEVKIQLGYTPIENAFMDKKFQALDKRDPYLIRKPIEAYVALPAHFDYGRNQVEEWIHNGMYYLRLFDENSDTAPEARMSPVFPPENFDTSPLTCAYHYKDELKCRPLPTSPALQKDL